jgi:hypothetical protein
MSTGQQHPHIKVNLTASVLMERPSSSQRFRIAHTTAPLAVSQGDDVDEALQALVDAVEGWLEAMHCEGSESALVGTISMRLEMADAPLFSGGARSWHSRLPPSLKNKKALLDVQVPDEDEWESRCFQWAVVAGLHAPASGHGNPERHRQYVRCMAW